MADSTDYKAESITLENDATFVQGVGNLIVRELNLQVDKSDGEAARQSALFLDRLQMINCDCKPLMQELIFRVDCDPKERAPFYMMVVHGPEHHRARLMVERLVFELKDMDDRVDDLENRTNNEYLFLTPEHRDITLNDGTSYRQISPLDFPTVGRLKKDQKLLLWQLQQLLPKTNRFKTWAEMRAQANNPYQHADYVVVPYHIDQHDWHQAMPQLVEWLASGFCQEAHQHQGPALLLLLAVTTHNTGAADWQAFTNSLEQANETLLSHTGLALDDEPLWVQPAPVPTLGDFRDWLEAHLGYGRSQTEQTIKMYLQEQHQLSLPTLSAEWWRKPLHMQQIEDIQREVVMAHRRNFSKQY